MDLLSRDLDLACEVDFLFVEFHHLPGKTPGSGRANLTRWGLPEDHYERVKSRIHGAMEARPGCRLKVYWRSFWAACGDTQRFEWEATEQVTDVKQSRERAGKTKKRHVELRRRLRYAGGTPNTPVAAGGPWVVGGPS